MSSNEKWYDGVVRFLHKFWWVIVLLIFIGIYLIIDFSSPTINLIW